MVSADALHVPAESTAQLLTWLNGDLLIQALYTVVVLDIADSVEAEPQTAEDLAAAVGAQAPPLARVLRMLAGHGVFEEDAAGRFGHTPLSLPLLRDRPGSVRDWVLFVGDRANWSATGALLAAVQTGKSAFETVHGEPLDLYLGHQPALGTAFAGWMTRQSELHNAALVAAYDFSTCTTIVDVGGGQGATLAAVLRANPAARGILLDLPYVVAEPAPLLATDVAARATIIAGDARQAVPVGGDCYLIKRVLMDRSDAMPVIILRHCADAMTSDGRVLIIEMVVPPVNAPGVGKDFDVRMLVQREAGAVIRTVAEFERLCAAAGLRLARVLPTASPNVILEAVRAEPGAVGPA